MKKAAKIIGIILSVLILFVLVFVAYLNFSPLPKYEIDILDVKLENDSLSISNGAKIAQMTCANCHLSNDGKLGGKSLGTDDFGELFAPNITSHPTYGIANYSPGELTFLLRTGISKDGNYTPPWMPKLPLMSDEDLADLVAFLKSDHSLVQPSDNEWPKSNYTFLAKALMKLKVFGPLDYPKQIIPVPNISNPIEHGQYLATAVYDCFACHSPDFKTVNVEYPEKTPGYFSGGNPMLGKDGAIILTKNLTMHPETGLGNWTKESFIRSVKSGIKPDGSGTNQYPMPPFSLLKDEEVGAIWAYLQSIPVIKNDNG